MNCAFWFGSWYNSCTSAGLYAPGGVLQVYERPHRENYQADFRGSEAEQFLCSMNVGLDAQEMRSCGVDVAVLASWWGTGAEGHCWTPTDEERRCRQLTWKAFADARMHFVPFHPMIADNRWWRNGGLLSDELRWRSAAGALAARLDAMVDEIEAADTFTKAWMLREDGRPVLLIWEPDTLPVRDDTAFWEEVFRRARKIDRVSLWAGLHWRRRPFGFSKVVPYTSFGYPVLRPHWRDSRTEIPVVASPYQSPTYDEIWQAASNHIGLLIDEYGPENVIVPCDMNFNKTVWLRANGQTRIPLTVEGRREWFCKQWASFLLESGAPHRSVNFNELFEGGPLARYPELIRMVFRRPAEVNARLR